MRLAQVTLQRDWGGAEQHVSLLCQGLRAEGAEVVLCCHPRGGLRRNAEAQGLPWRPVVAANQMDLTAALKLAARLAPVRPDILHLHTPKDYVCGALAARILRRPAVLTRHMLLPVKPLMRRIYTASGAVFCLTDSIRDSLRAQGIPPSRLHHARPGIDTACFDTPRTREQRPIHRQRWGALPEDIVFGCVGRLVEGKGHQSLLEAFARALGFKPESAPGLRLVIVGDGPLRSQLEAAAAQLDIASMVHFAGFCDDVPAAHSGLDALVLPSHGELLPLSILEGMASGLPVLATRVGGVGEAVEDDVTGLLVEPGDIDGLGAALLALALAPDLRDRLGRRGQEHARREFTLQEMVVRTLRIYDAVIASARGGSAPDRD